MNIKFKIYISLIIIISIIMLLYLYIIFGLSINENKFIPTPYSNENWMANIIPNTYFKDIVLPGTHDSLANSNAKIYNTEGTLAKMLYKFKWIPGINHKVTRWSRSQTNDVIEQLSRGIRFFDFRISYTEQDKKCYGVHTIMFREISDTLDKIDNWLLTHPKEVIIIKYRSDSSICDIVFRRKLEKWILPTKYDPFKMKLDDIYKLNTRLILTTDIKLKDNIFNNIHPDIVYHDWKNTFSAEEKENYIIKSLENWNIEESKLFNLDWTVTPQTKDIIINNSSLISHATKMNNNLDNFLKKLDPKLKTKIRLISVDNEKSIDLIKVIVDHNLNKLSMI